MSCLMDGSGTVFVYFPESMVFLVWERTLEVEVIWLVTGVLSLSTIAFTP